MKVATWNLERPRKPRTRSRKNSEITKRINELDADIWILTETNACINLSPEYVGFPSSELRPCKGCNYTVGENQVTVWIKKEYASERVKVSNPATSVCISLETKTGEFLVYGTLIGALGHPSQNVNEQIDDWRMVSDSGKRRICIAGDFNVQFGIPHNPTNRSKEKIVACFTELGITNLTSGIEENVDHIAISDQFLANAPHAETHIWNVEKKRHDPNLSDHIGVAVLLNI